MAGYLGLPEFAFPNCDRTTGSNRSPSRPPASAHPALSIEWLLVGLSVVAAAVGLGLGYWIYQVQKGRARRPACATRALARLSRSGAGFDALYRAVAGRPQPR